MTKVLNRISKRLIIPVSIFFLFINVTNTNGQNTHYKKVDYKSITVGAAHLEKYLPLIDQRKIAVVANPASLIANTHLIDSLLSLNITVTRIFSPEHGFRGRAEAGETVVDGKDSKTGIDIVSIYGNHKKPTHEDLVNIELVVFDLQDVGVRFYTYISTLALVMEACAENNIPIIVLDRPNPNGFFVDGPILDTAFSSFVGMHTVPIIYGMTIGEYAQMINGERWLNDDLKCDLTVIQLSGYKHNMLFELPVKPSPNLPNWQSIYLYPSLCLFEGTIMSVGRGTDYPFQLYGHPKFMIGSTVFKPKSIPGISLHPKFENQDCFGQSLRGYAENFKLNDQQLSLRWLLGSYELLSDKYKYFTDYFDLLAGTDKLREQIEAGMTEEEIRNSWKAGIDRFKLIRSKYLIYD